VVRYPNLMTLQCQRLSFAELRKAQKDIENLLIAGAQSRRRETLVIKSEARSDNQLFLSRDYQSRLIFADQERGIKRICVSLKKSLD
jgi:hypothetical protein